MLTLKQLKEIVDVPETGEKMPSAKHLVEHEKAVAWKKIGEDAEITAYQSGHALYRVRQAATVFPIHTCGGYQYDMEDASRMEGEGFEQAAWHLRLVLEGEDRIHRNQEARERRKTVSYSAAAEDWRAMTTGNDPVLERVVMEETVDQCLALLTSKQCAAVLKCYLGREPQVQIAKELGISAAAVSRLLSRAVQRMRKAKPSESGEI